MSEAKEFLRLGERIARVLQMLHKLGLLGVSIPRIVPSPTSPSESEPSLEHEFMIQGGDLVSLQAGIGQQAEPHNRDQSCTPR